MFRIPSTNRYFFISAILLLSVWLTIGLNMSHTPLWWMFVFFVGFTITFWFFLFEMFKIIFYRKFQTKNQKNLLKNNNNSWFLPPSINNLSNKPCADCTISNQEVTTLSSTILSYKKSNTGLIARAFASVEEGINRGWLFEDKIGTFNNAPVYRFATLGDNRWEFDGLTGDHQPIVSESFRLFGRLKYRVII